MEYLSNEIVFNYGEFIAIVIGVIAIIVNTIISGATLIHNKKMQRQSQQHDFTMAYYEKHKNLIFSYVTEYLKCIDYNMLKLK